MTGRFAASMLAAVLLAACSTGDTGSTPSTSIAPAVVTTGDAATTTSMPATTTTAAPSGTTVTEDVVEIAVSGEQVSGGGRIPIDLGATVTLVVTADVSDEMHLHGYDLSAPVTAAEPGRLEFTADIPGVFELELEESGLKLADLEVAP